MFQVKGHTVPQTQPELRIKQIIKMQKSSFKTNMSILKLREDLFMYFCLIVIQQV